MKASKQSGYKGVSWNKTRQRWIGRFQRDGVMHHVGYWSSKEDARKAVLAAVAEFDSEDRDSAEKKRPGRQAKRLQGCVLVSSTQEVAS